MLVPVDFRVFSLSSQILCSQPIYSGEAWVVPRGLQTAQLLPTWAEVWGRCWERPRLQDLGLLFWSDISSSPLHKRFWPWQTLWLPIAIKVCLGVDNSKLRIILKPFVSVLGRCVCTCIVMRAKKTTQPITKLDTASLFLKVARASFFTVFCHSDTIYCPLHARLGEEH